MPFFQPFQVYLRVRVGLKDPNPHELPSVPAVQVCALACEKMWLWHPPSPHHPHLLVALPLEFLTESHLVAWCLILCQLDCAKRCLVKHYFWVYPWRCYWKKLEFDSTDWVKRSAPTNVGTTIPSVEGLNRTKKKRKEKLSFLELGWASFPVIRHWSSWFLGLPTPGLVRGAL